MLMTLKDISERYGIGMRKLRYLRDEKRRETGFPPKSGDVLRIASDGKGKAYSGFKREDVEAWLHRIGYFAYLAMDKSKLIDVDAVSKIIELCPSRVMQLRTEDKRFPVAVINRLDDHQRGKYWWDRDAVIAYAAIRQPDRKVLAQKPKTPIPDRRRRASVDLDCGPLELRPAPSPRFDNVLAQKVVRGGFCVGV